MAGKRILPAEGDLAGCKDSGQQRIHTEFCFMKSAPRGTIYFTATSASSTRCPHLENTTSDTPTTPERYQSANTKLPLSFWGHRHRRYSRGTAGSEAPKAKEWLLWLGQHQPLRVPHRPHFWLSEERLMGGMVAGARQAAVKGVQVCILQGRMVWASLQNLAGGSWGRALEIRPPELTKDNILSIYNI